MPHTLPIDLADFPAFRTRKALLIIDLQNEFLSLSGTLPVTTPDGFVNRTLDVANRFRESGSGDIFWVRSQFDAHRPAGTSQIITTNKPLSDVVGSRPNSARRRKESEPPSDDQDADPEAFLSMSPNQKQEKSGQTQRGHNLLAGSHGSELAPSIASSVNARQDLVLTKTHYSAFHSTQLLNRLRTRFVTELYLCGALTNISIYATALDAARHGLSLTIIEDCCGYRDITRHENAIASLIQLTGCETLSAENVLESMVPQPSDKASAVNDFAAAIAAITGASSGPPRARRLTKSATAAPTIAVSSSPGAIGRISGGLPVRTKNPVPSEDNNERSKTLPPSPSPSPPSFKNQTQITPASHETPALSLLHPAAKDFAVDEPETPQSLQSLVANDTATSTKGSPAITTKVVILPTDSSAGTFDPIAKDSLNTATSTVHATFPKPTITPKTFDAQTSAPIEPREISTGRITPNEDADQDDDTDTLLRLTASPRHAKLMEYSRLQSKRNAPSLKSRLEDLAEKSDTTSSKQHVKKTNKIVAPAATAMHSQSVSADVPAASCVSKAATAPTSSNFEESPVYQYAAAPTTTGSESDSRPQSGSDAMDKTKDLDIGARNSPISTQQLPSTIGPICAGDTVIHHDVLPKSLESGIFERLQVEVQWQRMSHQGGEVPRLVCVQGEISKDGSLPVYRHPSDESPPLEAFTPTVVKIKHEVEKVVGHPLNHALIQLYRTGDDYISEHSDKTLDIVPGSYVCNMSLGAERTMVFRTKRVQKNLLHREEPSGAEGTLNASKLGNKRQIHRVQLPHNSLCCMGLQTNMTWLHAIRQDKRASRDKSPAALAYGGGRISLTFRQIGTFLNATQTLIWGQGAVAKLREDARPVVNGQSDEAIRMLRAFGAENHSSDFDWKAQYGKGFDVLHMSSSPRFFASTDAVVNMTIQLFLADLGVKYARGSMSSAPAAKKDSTDSSKTDVASIVIDAPSSLDVSVRFVDNDKDRSAVQGVLAILLYLDAVYGTQPKERSAQYHLEQARKYTRLQKALLFQDRWRVLAANISDSDSDAVSKASTSSFTLQPLKGDLTVWEAYASETGTAGVEADVLSIAGASVPSFVDFAFWSVLHSMELAAGGHDALLCELRRVGATRLSTYYAAFKAQSIVRTVLAAAGIQHLT
ncbi:MAG: hypothetical protein SEPTF4163_005406 [Sporothrix epigloea]